MSNYDQLHIDPQQKSLPMEIHFCKRCVMSNQRPRIVFDDEGICSACRYAESKQKKIDWVLRKKQFQELCDKHRSKDGSFDVVVPCSGGKDSSMIAHRLKNECGMHPLCVTFSPPLYTDIGWKNLRAFIESGFDHVLVSPSGTINRALSRAAFIHLGDHNEVFDHGQMSAPFRVAYNYGIKLVMYGENGEAEYGGTTDINDKPGMPWEDFERCYYSMGLDNLVDIALEHGHLPRNFNRGELTNYRLPPIEEMQKLGVEMHWFAYYQYWTPQENYYYATKHTGFQANPEGRSEGTYSKYAQLDDRTDAFLYYMMFIKYGFGRATSDAAHEIRDGHIDRDEAVALVRRYDGEFPKRYFKTFLKYINIDEQTFYDVVDNFRLPHIWKKENSKWTLRHQVQ
jgi:N-acetyl sugar amidotransferase